MASVSSGERPEKVNIAGRELCAHTAHRSQKTMGEKNCDVALIYVSVPNLSQIGHLSCSCNLQGCQSS